MEPDLPLIEIPGEEEISPIARLRDKSDAANHTASGFNNGNKENINVNKSELTKLSVEPQQMKRRKKGSAYNFRKSIAWDKAFSTDEGFLDPLELSMLGGSNDNSCKEFLPSVSEDGGKFSGNSYSTDDSSNLQGTPKTMSNEKCGNSGSKSCCPRPLVFSSLKRPANASILKAAAKESKLPKLPVSKSGAHSHLKSSKSNLPSTSQSGQRKFNQVGQEDIQKVAKPQITSKFTRTSSKSGSDSVSLLEKSLIQQSRRNKDMPAGEIFSSSDLQLRQSSLAGRANCVHKAPSAALSPGGSETADSHEVVRRDKVISGKVSVAATTSLVQSRKPSGLRMPSPSLGFFSQPKASSCSKSSIQKASQPVNITGSNVPNSGKLNILNSTYDSRLPHVPVKLLNKVDNNSSNGSSNVSRSSSQCVSSSNYDNTHENDMPARNIFSSSDLQLQQSSLTGRANCGHKAPSAGLPAIGSDTADSHEVVRRDKILSEKVSVAATTSQVQSREPSGLRMPSPSLGFFSQPKSSGSNSSIQKATQPINITGSNVSNSRKLNILNCTYDSRMPHVPVKLLKKVDNNLSNGSSDVSRSSSESVSSSDYDNTHDNMNAKLAKNIVSVKELKVSLHDKSAEVRKEIEAAQGTSDCDIEIQRSEDSYKVDQTSFLQHMDFQKNDNHCLIIDKSSDQLKKNGSNIIVDSSEPRGSDNVHLENTSFVSQISCQVFDQDVHEITDTVYRQHAKDNLSGSSIVVHGIISESQSEDSAGHFEQDSVLMMRNDNSKASDVDQWKMVKVKSPNRFSGEDEDVIMLTLPVRNDEIFLEDKCFKLPTNKREDSANGISKLCDAKRSEILSSNVPPLKGAEQANKDDSGFDQGHDEYSVADDSDSSLLFKGASAEKCERIHGLETHISVFSEVNHSDIVTEKQCVNQVAVAVMSDSFEKPPVGVSLSNAKGMIGSVQDHSSYINSQARPGRSLETSRDHESLELFYVGKEEIVGGEANDMENQLQPKLAEVSSNKCFLEIEKKLEDSKSPHLSQPGQPVKPPIHAIPFSDEWLAAVEAAGEEILSMKRGAVQNSPTEKALPEPSPWSPVKKKQNQIGPYDCTKFINVPHSSDQI